MQSKLLMHWNIRKNSEAEYFEFLVHEFIPGVGKLGLHDMEIWFTTYGDCEQILVTGMMETAVSMQSVINSEAWAVLVDDLSDYVEEYAEKIVPGSKGFQF